VPIVCPVIPSAELVASIHSAQNRDGGWGYHPGSSWTEPTAFALLALSAVNSAGDNFAQGMRWLRNQQRPDGGWAPHPSVAQTTWVTAPAVLALLEGNDTRPIGPALAWLNRQKGEESSLVDRLRRFLLGARLEAGEGTEGWPWLPGTAGWVMPTSLTILALEKAAMRGEAGDGAGRIRQGRDFLMARICRDGGWNYGGPSALGFSAESYPDTTGMALMALHGAESPQVQTALSKAEQQLPRCHSAQTLCWLSLGLAAHGRPTATGNDCPFQPETLLDRALLLLARAPEAGGKRVWGAV